jgi:hypothetical protein
VHLWVRQEAYAEGLDSVLEQTVRTWIETTWPFQRVAWPDRER